MLPLTPVGSVSRVARVSLGALCLFVATALVAAPKLKVLILDGQNNHKWAETTPALKVILEDTGRFTVDVSTTPPGLPKTPKGAEVPKLSPEQQIATAQAWAAWRPHFADYDVVVSNYNGEDWPEPVRAALVAYVKNGGGFVSYHAADNAFASWPEYNQMIGLGGWGGRKADAGPNLRLRDGKWVKLPEPDGPTGGHSPRAEFMVENFAPQHPIMQGLPAQWMHAADELYHRLRGPADNIEVVGYGTSKETHEAEPLIMTITFGQGRVFHTTLGHDLGSINGLGFQIVFARGTEWAATGKVTLLAPPAGTLSDKSPATLRKISVPAAAK